MTPRELAAALARLKSNPDFKLFEEFLEQLEKRAVQAIVSSKEMHLLPVLQGRVQTFIAIREEIHNVTRQDS